MVQRIALALLLAAMMASGAIGPTTVLADDEITVGTDLALGDSIAYGIGVRDPGREGYVARLFASAARPGPGGVQRLTNLAQPVETTFSMLLPGGQLTAALDRLADPTDSVRLVTLDIGGNDLLGLLLAGPCAADPAGDTCHRLIAAALSGTAWTYPTILGALRGALDGRQSGAPMLIMTYYNPWSGTGSPLEPVADAALLGADGVVECGAAAADPAAAGLNDIIACAGPRFGATVVDVYPAFKGGAPGLTWIAQGNIHPNAAGHQAIADAFARALGSPAGA